VPKIATTLDAIPVKPGMRSRIAPSHEWKHGAPLQDEPNIPLSREAPIPHHSGMTDRQIIGVANNPTSGQILHDAANLGKPRKA
jgi:hypothetical protein